jgi:regulator of sirC expression with transglutaminase-like and TPR domain
MNPGTIALPEELSESQRSALIKLLGDEDPAIYHQVRETILSHGPRAVGWLRPHTLSSDPALRRRAVEIVHHFGRQAADDKFLAFCLKQGEDLDLEQGAWLLAQTRYPEINIEAYSAVLDGFAGDLRERLCDAGEPRQVVAVINSYLFEELHLAGNEENYYDPENSYLNCVLDRRTGNPINLCLLYMLLGRRLRLPIAGIGLPGHFICRYQSTAEEIYIDAFSHGKTLTKADCVQYLVQGNYSLREDYMAPVTPRRMLLRICSNLHQIYLHLEVVDEITRFQRYLVALSR